MNYDDLKKGPTTYADPFEPDYAREREQNNAEVEQELDRIKAVEESMGDAVTDEDKAKFEQQRQAAMRNFEVEEPELRPLQPGIENWDEVRKAEGEAALDEEDGPNATVGEVFDAVWDNDSVASWAGNAYRINYVNDRVDPDFDAAEWILSDAAEGVDQATLLQIKERANNEEAAGYMVTRALEVQENERIKAERQGLAIATGLGIGLVEGVGLFTPAKALHVGATTARAVRLQNQIARLDNSLKFRAIKGGSEFAYLASLEDSANMTNNNELGWAIAGSVIEGVFGRNGLNQVRPVKNVDKDGNITTTYETIGPNETFNGTRNYTDEQVQEGFDNATERTGVAFETPTVKHEIETADAVRELSVKGRKEALKTLKRQEDELRQAEAEYEATYGSSSSRDEVEGDGSGPTFISEGIDEWDEGVASGAGARAGRTSDDWDDEGSGFGSSYDEDEWADEDLGGSGFGSSYEGGSGGGRSSGGSGGSYEGMSYDQQRAYDHVQEIKESKRRTEENLKDYDNQIDETVKRIDEIKKLDPDEAIDASPMVYNLLGKQREQLQRDFGDMADEMDFDITLPEDKMQSARSFAEENEDWDMVARIDKQMDKAKRRHEGHEEDSKGWGKDGWLQDMGQRATRYKGVVGRMLTKLNTTTQSRGDGKAVQSGADFYKEQFTQEFNSIFSRLSHTGYINFLKEQGTNNIVRRGYAKGSDGFAQYSSDVVEYMHATSKNLPTTKQYPQSVVDLGEEMKTEIGNMRARLQRAGWEVPDVLDLTADALSRGRDDDAWKAAFIAFEKDQIEDVFVGAIVSAQPAINLKFKLRALKAQDAPDTFEIKELEARIKEVESNPDMRQEMVAEAMENPSGYVKAIARGYIAHSHDRALGLNVDLSKAINETQDMDIMEVLQTMRPEVMNKLSPEDRGLLQNALEYSKDSKGNATDVFKQRIDMDSTFTLRMNSRDGEEMEVGVIDFFSDDLDGTMHNMVNQYSSAFSLAKVGYKNFDEFNADMDKAVEAAKEMTPASLREDAFNDIEMTRKYFMGQSQYDDSGPWNQFKRATKHYTNWAKMGYLVFTLPMETARIAVSQGIEPALRNLPEAMRSLREIGSMDPDESGFTRTLALMGMESMNPFMNYMGRMDAGVSIGTGKSKGKFGVNANDINTKPVRILNTAENIARTLSHTTMSLSRGVDIMNRRLAVMSTIDNLMNVPEKRLKNQRYIDVGIDEEFISQLQRAKRYIKMEGKRIVDIDHKAWRAADPELMDEFVNKVVRLADRQVQTTRFGQMPPLINTQIFSWIGQFKSFALGTYNNQLKYELGSIRDTEAMVMGVTQTLAGAGIAYAREAIRAKVEGRENRMNDLEPWQLLLIGFRNTGQFALASMAVDTLYGLTGNSFLSQYSTTNQTGLPVNLQMADDLARTIPELGTAWLDPNTEVGREQLQRTLGAIAPAYPVIPLSHSAQWLMDMPDETKNKGKDVFDLQFDDD